MNERTDLTYNFFFCCVSKVRFDCSRGHGHVANDYISGDELDTSDFEDLAQDSGFEFLDYYFYADLELGQMPLDFRVGNMVVSWGESTFIQNGINSINPFDLSALRNPGAKLFGAYKRSSGCVPIFQISC